VQTKSLITALLLSQSDATVEETSLMQGMVARRSQLTPEAPTKEARQESTAKLMETATRMIKNGATPDVVTFIETTITEVNEDVLGAILDEHARDQQLINDLLVRFDDAVSAMEVCAASVRGQHTEREASSTAHKQCRSLESIACARSRRCEGELEEKWRMVQHEEGEMREIHKAIHGEWCVGPEPPQPDLDDPFVWIESRHSEGDETSLSEIPYPHVAFTDAVIEFRRFSVTQFESYIIQKPRVETAWEEYNSKLLECAAYEETWTLKVDECDGLQDTLHGKACQHMSDNRECASNFGHAYNAVMNDYTAAVETIRQLEYDRKREWETLHIVTCLLETVYTHVIHSIDSGDPCPTTESHPEQTAAEINTCHIIEDSLTTHLTIDYGNPPTPPELPPVIPPPCTAAYIWEEHGSFGFEIEATHRATLESEELSEHFSADLSLFGWAGCAAPKACIPCETPDHIFHDDNKDLSYEGHDVCKAHQSHLAPGQMDRESFRCASGDQCIMSSGRCNGIDNCDDASDETGCDTVWGVPAVLHTEECHEPFISDVQFRCEQSSTCTPIAAKCNGVQNCPDNEDEQNCPTTTVGVTLEATTGFTATIETPAVGSRVFTDRTYTIDSLGSFTGYSFIKMSNEDKHTSHSHVQMKVRLQHPTVVYVVKLDDKELPWLNAEGWTLTHLDGMTYHGTRETRHTDWSGTISEHHYGPGQVWEKMFTAGTVEVRGNEGGDGSYVMFMAHPSNLPTPVPAGNGEDNYIGCFVDDSTRDMGPWLGGHTNAATNTFEGCHAACNKQYMALQWGGECFCADAYGTGPQYHQVADSECNMNREPCSSNSHNCGGTWHQAIYRV
jgi:hypothetical protein